MQFQLLNLASSLNLPMLGIIAAAFVAGGIFGPKLFAKLGIPGLALGVTVTQSVEQKLKALMADLTKKQDAAAVLGLPPAQIEPAIQAAIAEHFTSTK
ncbi:MAG: hypothetical protein K8U03_09335 [Planctomycetia bacterium]|nr:hypothetical protein [Planctomycetia bacterium]